MNVQFDVSDLNAKLRVMSDRMQNNPGLNAELADILLLFVDDNFENERSASGAWPAMRDITQRLRRGGEGKLLQDIGLLAKIQTDSGPDFAEVFTNVEYAKYHLKGPRKLVPLGHKTGTWHLPVRDFFDIDMNEALAAMSELVVSEMARY